VVGLPPRQMLHFVQHDNLGLALCGESLTQDTSRVLKKGSAEGRSPFAGSLRVSLRYNVFSPFLARKGVRGMVEGVFQYAANTGCGCNGNIRHQAGALPLDSHPVLRFVMNP